MVGGHMACGVLKQDLVVRSFATPLWGRRKGDLLVVADAFVQAVPQHLEPAVAERSQCGVMALPSIPSL